VAAAEIGLHRAELARDLLRLATAGSVDDGKSTLIGRLLHDSRAIADDQLAAIEQASRRRGGDGLDLALLTDGLRAEREQGITIDVAYRHFVTARRRFVLADTPGHVQYTRNMVTGVSTADAAIVLVDARAGVLEQTRRHVAIVALLRVPHLVVAVNKMDLVAFDAARFAEIAAEVDGIGRRLGVFGTTAIPLSALHGDNVVERSSAMPWYEGPSLLEHLETLDVEPDADDGRLRLPVQWVIRGTTASVPNYRAYAGRVERGRIRPGQRVVAQPGAIATTVRAIDTLEGPIEEALRGSSVAVRLTYPLDLGRGGMIADELDVPGPVDRVDAIACWLDPKPLRSGDRYLVQHTTRVVRAVVERVDHRLDLYTLDPDGAADTLGANDIGRLHLRLADPIFADAFADDRVTGSAILIDETTHATVAALLLEAEPGSTAERPAGSRISSSTFVGTSSPPGFEPRSGFSGPNQGEVPQPTC
jgi:sulfate adenylyltransferase large subunit